MGIDKFKAMLDKRIQLALNAMAGVVLEKSDKIIPVDTGFLANSKFSQLYNNNKSVRVGYNSKYATYVHEKPNQKFKRPGAENKFLEKAMTQTKEQRDKIIEKVMKV